MLKVLLTVAAIALVVWVVVRLLDRRIAGLGGPRGRQAPQRVTGPDDDPEFLRELERRRRRREQRDEPDSPGAT